VAKKKAKQKLANDPVWISRPNPLGLKDDYREVVWPLPKPGLPTLPPPSSTLPTLPVTKPVQERPVTKVLTVIPKVLIPPSNGRGNSPLNIDGYRMVNLFAISDPVLSTADRVFSLEVSFAPYTVEMPYGTDMGCEGTNVYNFDSLGYTQGWDARHYRLTLSDQDVNNTVKAGGRDLTHILRVPVLGPFMRVIVINRGTVARNVEVVAYLIS
jgi:hypothetical protein